MILTIMEIKKKPSRYGGHFFYVYFKSQKGKDYYSCIFPKLRNYQRWKKVLRVGVTLKELRLVVGKTKLIDADSRFKTLTKEK